jgi:hypothetical protein
MKKLLRFGQVILFVTLSFMPAVLPATPFARSAQNAQSDDDKGVKQDVRDAAHSTKQATIKTGKKAKRETKKVVNKSAEKTGQVADKVEDKTKP